MNKKEKHGRIAADAVILLGMLSLLCLICRLWPILLLIILGIFVAALQVLFTTLNKTEVITPLPPLPEPKSRPTIKDLERLAYSIMLTRITELVTKDYPEARWIWETPDAVQEILMGGEVFILLNRAGGYRRAKVVHRNLQVVEINYHPEEENGDSKESAEDDISWDEPLENNYELLAFEWSEAHILELNERCNEAIGQGKNELLIPLEELPDPESWQDICKELVRAGLEKVKVATDGILILL